MADAAHPTRFDRLYQAVEVLSIILVHNHPSGDPTPSE
jgi:DNA repair protein RadC